MSIFKFITILILIIPGYAIDIEVSKNPDVLKCSNNQAAIGLTLGIPTNDYWQESSAFFLCMLCSEVRQSRFNDNRLDKLQRDREESRSNRRKSSSSSRRRTKTSKESSSRLRQRERDSQNSRQEQDDRKEILIKKTAFTQEICSFYGDSSEALIQKFDCLDLEFMKSLTKMESSVSSNFSCDVLRKDSSPVSFKSTMSDRTKTTRTNWRDWDIQASCPRDKEFLCGLKSTRPKESVPPHITPLCCEMQMKSSAPLKFLAPSGFGDDCSAAKAWIGVLAFLVIVLAIALGVYLVNICCCRILPLECFPGTDHETYFSRWKKGDPELPSQFNTRPNTGAPPSSSAPVEVTNSSANGSATSNGRNSINGNMRSAVVRPVTSSVRRKSSSVDVQG